jgi:hypothetical protein
MWKNGGPAVPIGPEKVTILAEWGEGADEESSPDGVVSDGDAYAASRATVLKNGQPLFTLKPRSAGADCTVQGISVVK